MLMALINFALIGDGAYERGDTKIITNSVKIGFREINIGVTHMFCTRKVKNPSELWKNLTIFLVQMYTQMRFCLYVATLLANG